ncbi:MAG: RDD family protein [Gammaproteobacteria bacterium]|nr:RDD family protein [Gammaproteobacteria bacterium]
MQASLTVPSITGVDVELRVAGPGGRSYAFIIDWHIRALVALAWLFLAGAAAGAVGAERVPFAYAALWPAAGIYFLYHPVLEIVMSGRTPGKRIAGVRLLKLDGSVPGAGALLIRNVFRLVDSLPLLYCVGLAAAILTRNSVRLGDIAAGTVLVYDEPETESLAGLSGRAVERLGLKQAEVVRELLSRWKELDPSVRRELAQRVLAGTGVEPGSDDDAALHSALEAALR